MLIAHLADLHLGYRAYHRLAPGSGFNAREVDVARAFRAALEQIIQLEADLVLVAGDVFHTVRPSNAAIADAFRQFSRLREALPRAPVVVVAGNHDSPRAVETGSILRLFAEISGVHVADSDARLVHLPELDTSVLCLPHAALARGEPILIEPDPAARINLLVAHGDAVGAEAEGKIRYATEYGGARLETAEIHAERWDYVALGHYHISTELAPNMWYAGAIERTSTNIWEEAADEKGFLTFDTRTRAARLHPLPTRAVFDLPRFSASSLTAGDVDAQIRARVDTIPGGLADKLVRLVIEEVPREVFRELDHKQIRAYRAEALHFHLDARRPDVHRTLGYGAPYRRRTLEEEVEGFLTRFWQPSSQDIEPARLLELAQQYLAEAAAAAPAEPLIAAEPGA